jgi:hypothetical protein
VNGLALFLFILGPASVSAGPGPEDVARLTKERRDAARRAYLTAWANYRDGYVPEELVYRWSKRWLKAERAVDGSREGQVAAFRGHLDRMRQLESVVRKLQRVRLSTIDQVSAAEYYRSEAALWLARAKGGKKGR